MSQVMSLGKEWQRQLGALGVKPSDQAWREIEAHTSTSRRGKWRADVAELVGVRRTRNGAWVVNGRRFRTMALAICYVNEMLFGVLLPNR